MDSLQPKKNTNSIGTFIVTFILTILVLLFFAYPKYKDYSAAVAAHATVAEDLQKVKDQQAALENVFGKMNDSRPDLDKVNVAIPDKPDIPDLYALVETQAKSAGLTLTSVQAGDEADKIDNNVSTVIVGAGQSQSDAGPSSPSPTLGVVDLNMQVSGTLDGYAQFLRGMQQSLRLIDIQSIDISADPDKGTLTFRTVLKTYYQKQQ